MAKESKFKYKLQRTNVRYDACVRTSLQIAHEIFENVKNLVIVEDSERNCLKLMDSIVKHFLWIFLEEISNNFQHFRSYGYFTKNNTIF